MAIYESGNNEINSGKLSQIEVDLYGSSRLGLLQRNLDVESTNWWLFETTAMPGTSNGGTKVTLTRGSITYELSNHLGNVLATITDRKIQIDNNSDGTTDYYTADVITANDYYPFGSLQPGRNYNASGESDYRYGFNGKENDNDVKGEGNQQDYGLRIYDPRVGKFLSVDPLTSSYPMLTPYQFASNTPLWCIDLDGGEGKDATYYLMEFMNWLGDNENSLDNINRGKGPIGEKLNWFNRSINPVGIIGYNGYTVVTGNDLENPGNYSRLDAGGNLIIAYIFHRSGTIASTPSPVVVMRQQMAKNQAAMGSNAAVKSVMNDEIASNSSGVKNWTMEGIPEWKVPLNPNTYKIQSNLPTGFTEETFKVLSQKIANRAGNISTDIVIQGSRAAATATVYADLDIAIKVGAKQFDELIVKAFGNPAKGTAKWRSMEKAIADGRIFTGEAKLRDLRDAIQVYTGMTTQVSIVKIGGAFDSGAQIPIRAAVPQGVR